MRGATRLLDGLIGLFPRRAWWFFSVVCILLIFFGGSRSSGDLPDFSYLPPHADKILHFIAYSGLAACLFRAVFPLLATVRSPWGKKAWMPVVLIPSLVGLIDEAVVQGMAGGRGQDVWDWAADTAAGIVVLAVAWAWRERIRRRDEARRVAIVRRRAARRAARIRAAAPR